MTMQIYQNTDTESWVGNWELVLFRYFEQSWALSVLLDFFNNKNDFLHFYQVSLTGSGLFK